MTITREFRIEGMNCNHCAMAVRKELSKIPGVQVKEVRIGSATLDYDEANVSTERIKSAVEDAGYAFVG